MKVKSFWTLVLIIAGPLWAEDNPSQTKELKKLAGAWVDVTIEVDGKVQPADKAPKKLVFTGNKLTGFGPNMTIKVDPEKKPKWIDLTFEKDGKTFPVHAIYEAEGDVLKICIPLAPKGGLFKNERPEGFETKGKPILLLKARRAKKK